MRLSEYEIARSMGVEFRVTSYSAMGGGTFAKRRGVSLRFAKKCQSVGETDGG